MPIRLSSLTLCWVGFVLSSPDAAVRHESDMAVKDVLLPIFPASCLMASRYGRPSMSPTVPPISAMTTSLSSPTLSILSCISLVIWGMTCTVARCILRFFPLDHRGIYLSGRTAVFACDGLVDETFIMAEVEVGLSSVPRYEDLPCWNGLIAGIYIDIWVHLQAAYPVALLLSKAPSDAAVIPLPERDDAAGNKNKLSHI